ncbi:MAG: HNH endonuclease [Lentimicrobiaceae bacterium]|jgi:5-methylcytosine-specific restriction endonuclease McrA|nr:HNH endonuclease [Lentimicrobiaceae bacterium]
MPIHELTLEDYWRGIILRGKNSASYKFALAQSLLELKPQSGQLIQLGDIAPTFAKHLTQHLKGSDKQGAAKSSKFLNICRDYNAGKLTDNELVDATIRHGFVNVIDAFHVVGKSDIPKRFYEDERKANNGIRITDEFSELLEREQASNLPFEVESRWRLVETAWELNISHHLISMDYDQESGSLFTTIDKHRRKAITSSRDALNGYQKGKCFYCFDNIYLDDKVHENPDVDHFFPHTLKQYGFVGIDGIWNLVLSCQSCNRGLGGKFDSVPKEHLLKRLHTRNEHLISSHHPLRETLILQTGKNEQARKSYLNDYYNNAHKTIIHTWEPEEKHEKLF